MIPDIDQITALLERVEGATGPDREIDAAIYRAVFNDGGWVGGNWYIDGGRGSSVISLPGYTSSLDAITGLIERELPGWRLDTHDTRLGQQFEAVLCGPGKHSWAVCVGHAASRPLSCCAAFLRAYRAKLSQGEA